jgi:hypothetical protein
VNGQNRPFILRMRNAFWIGLAPLEVSETLFRTYRLSEPKVIWRDAN